MKLHGKILARLILTGLILAGCHFPGRPWVLAEITSHEAGQALIINEEVRIISQAKSSQGIEKIELYINGELEHVDQPPTGNPLEYIADQPWIPFEDGQVMISVIAIDRRGNTSEPVSIILQVVPSIYDIETEPTPTPTLNPEELAATQTAQASCTNSASFVEHVTIPNNAYVSASSNFTKIWRVNNNGTCDWSGYQVVHSSGNIMGANSPKGLPSIRAGSNADIVVDMEAPGGAGAYSAIWRIQSADGTIFGPDLLVSINIPELPTETPTPTATFTLTPTITPTFTLTPSPTPTWTASPTPLPLSVEQISEQISIPIYSTENKTVTCPTGSVVVSGGFTHQLGIRVWGSHKDGNGWRVSATNTQWRSRTLTVTAICLFNSGGTSNQVTTQENAKASDTTSISVTCPSGSIVTGGGWVIGRSNDLMLYQSVKSGNGWQILVSNPSSETPEFNLYAVCLSGVSGGTTQDNQSGTALPSQNTTELPKQCPSGTYVTGGGFDINAGLILYGTIKQQNGWINYVSNPTNAEQSFETFAICLSP